MTPGTTTLGEARAFLEEFNYFHDGFIRDMKLHSGDEFEAVGHQLCSGRFDLEFVIAHYNYGPTPRPAGQEVVARFGGVKELEMKVSGLAHEWSVDKLEFEEGARVNEMGREEPCLRARLIQHELDTQANEWRRARVMEFTFRSVEMEER